MSAALQTLDRVRHVALATVARTPGPAADALFTLAKADKLKWSHAEWLARLADMDSYTGTVDDWLALRV